MTEEGVSVEASSVSGQQQQKLVECRLGERRGRISEFYRNRSVLITGGSGFIGKVLIEKLLRSCPDLKRIYVLIRPKWNKSPQERIVEILKAPLFEGVREGSSSEAGEDLTNKVICVEGDVTRQNLGLSEQNLLRIMNEVSVIYHSAATVKFDEPLKQSIGINITGTKNMIELCRKIPQLVSLVHVSTAYANCDRPEIDEHVYPVDMEPEKLIELASWMEQESIQELKKRFLGNRPNTYTYTKAIAEWLLVKSASDLPVVICRPSIVVASWQEPFRGWIDNVNGPTGVVLGAGKGLIRSMYAQPSYVADLIPVDTVINLIITLGWFGSVYQEHKQHSRRLISESNLNSESSADESLDSLTTSHSKEGEHEEQQQEVRAQAILTISCSSDSDTENNNNNNNNNISDIQNNDLIKYKQDENYLGGTPRNQLSKKPASNPDDGYSSQASSLDQLSAPPGDGSEANANNNTGHQRAKAFIKQRRISQEERQAAFEYKVKQFRHSLETKLAGKKLPTHLADVPVFHCTSGDKKPITWGQVSMIVISICALFPSVTTYRYPNGKFTNKKYLDDFYRFTLHYTPAYIMDFITGLFGGKPILVKIYRKFDQAARVLLAFTSKQWTFTTDNRIMLRNELMSEEDRHQFNFDISNLDWREFIEGYVLGVRQYLLKEPISNLDEARRNLTFVYYRNLILQCLFIIPSVYYMITFFFSSHK